MLKNKYIIILTVIVAVGFILRLVGFNFEYLFDYISDENVPNSCALRMIYNKAFSLNNCGNPYPALYTLINLPGIAAGLFILLLENNFNAEIIKQLVALYPLASTLPIMRLFSVVIGTATIVLIYKITGNLFNSRAKGLIAAAFLAVSLLPVDLSHWAKARTPVLFFTFLALYYAVLIYQKGSRKYYILAAIFISSAFGVHYTGFFSVIFIFLGHFFGKFKTVPFSFGELFRNNKNLYLGLGLSLFLSAFWVFLNRQGVYNFVFNPTADAGVSGYYGGGGLGHYFSGLFYYFKNFVAFDPVVFGLLGAAILFNFRKFFARRYLFFASFFIFYLAGMLLIDFGNKIRWSLPLIVISIPIVADFLGDFRAKFRSEIVYAAFIIFLLFPSLVFSAVWDYILTLPNTHFAAKTWVEENIPQNSKVLFLDLSLILPVSQDGAEDLEAALAGVRGSNPRYAYLAQAGQKAMPGYRVVGWDQYTDNPDHPEWQQFDYYILSYVDEAQYREKLVLMPPADILDLLHQIKPFNVQGIHRLFKPGRDSPFEYLRFLKDIRMTGPTIEIYKLKYE